MYVSIYCIYLYFLSMRLLLTFRPFYIFNFYFLKQFFYVSIFQKKSTLYLFICFLVYSKVDRSLCSLRFNIFIYSVYLDYIYIHISTNLGLPVFWFVVREITEITASVLCGSIYLYIQCTQILSTLYLLIYIYRFTCFLVCCTGDHRPLWCGRCSFQADSQTHSSNTKC